MRTRVNHSAMPAVGYVEPWSLKAGQEASVHVSCVDPEASVRVVRLDTNDKTRVADWHITKLAPLQVQYIRQGSWLEVDLDEAEQLGELTCEIELLITINAVAKPVLWCGGIGVDVDPERRLVLRVGDRSVKADEILLGERWYTVKLSVTQASVRVVFGKTAASVTIEAAGADGLLSSRLLVGASPDETRLSLNGRIGRISAAFGSTKYDWHLPVLGVVEEVPPVGAAGPKLRIINGPTFSVKSARWDGMIQDPRLGEHQYDAVHLHDDDFPGLDWPQHMTVLVPETADSGIYAIELSTSGGTEQIPFFVRPNKPRSKLAFLVPTATYLAYSDENLPPVRYPWQGTDRGHRFARDNNLLCLYDVHSDTSGVSLTSTRRPKATLRNDYHYPLANSPHLLPVDLQFLKHFSHHGIQVDLLTDHDLHAEGGDALRPYDGVFTGSHPEYWSKAMMDGLDEHLAEGGNLAYLGGNGFYWVVAFQDHWMELRRGKSDIWTSPPGEVHLALTGEPGAHWQDRGRSSQSYLGTTFLIMSFGPSRPYRRLEASYTDEYSWIFEGVGDELIGSEGSVLGGAAGYEIDGVLNLVDTPPNLARLATADDFDESFQLVPDIWLKDGDAERREFRRADMTVYRHPAGGYVFGTGSVAWIGSLPERGDNAVGAITRNVARGFAANRKRGGSQGVPIFKSAEF